MSCYGSRQFLRKTGRIDGRLMLHTIWQGARVLLDDDDGAGAVAFGAADGGGFGGLEGLRVVRIGACEVGDMGRGEVAEQVLRRAAAFDDAVSLLALHILESGGDGTADTSLLSQQRHFREFAISA